MKSIKDFILSKKIKSMDFIFERDEDPRDADPHLFAGRGTRRPGGPGPGRAGQNLFLSFN